VGTTGASVGTPSLIHPPCEQCSVSVEPLIRDLSRAAPGRGPETDLGRVNLACGCGVIAPMTIAAIDRTVGVEQGEDQLVRFVEAEYGALVAALSLVCGERAAAEDVTQEALARALIALRRGTSIDSLGAWVRVVALNLLRNRWRSLSRERRAHHRVGADLSRMSVDGLDAVDLEEAVDLRAAVATLSRRQREAVALHYRLGLSVAETARAMEVSDGTVKTLLSRARATLAAALDPAEVRRD